MSDRPNDDAISPDTMAALGAELGRMRNWQLWLIEMTPTDIWPADVGPGNLTEEFGSLLLSHLKWLEQKEADGVIVLSGPLDLEHGLGAGIAAIRAESRDEAETIAASEPFVDAGYRTNTVKAWNVNEGSLTMRVDLFANRITL